VVAEVLAILQPKPPAAKSIWIIADLPLVIAMRCCPAVFQKLW